MALDQRLVAAAKGADESSVAFGGIGEPGRRVRGEYPRERRPLEPSVIRERSEALLGEELGEKKFDDRHVDERAAGAVGARLAVPCEEGTDPLLERGIAGRRHHGAEA